MNADTATRPKPKHPRNKTKNKNKANANANSKKNNRKGKGQKNFQNVPVQPPRPSSFTNGTSVIEVRRESGSEMEDFQTPSVEYDIRNEVFNHDTLNCSKDWENFLWFDGDEELYQKKDDVDAYGKKNWNLLKDLSNIESTKKKEDHQEEYDELIIVKDNLQSNKENTDFESTKDLSKVPSEEGSPEIQQQFESEEEQGHLIEDKEELFSKEEETVNKSEVLSKDPEVQELVDNFFNLDNQETCECATEMEGTFNESIYMFDTVEEEGPPDLLWPHKETSVDEDKDDEMSCQDISYIACTDENLSGELLQLKYVVLEEVYEPTMIRSLSLSMEPSECSFRRSKDTTTNVTSISNESIPIKTEKEVKEVKKGKFKVYQRIIKRFRKKKIPEKEERVLEREVDVQTLPTPSTELVNDSHSLVLSNCLESNLQKVCRSDLIEEIEVEFAIEMAENEAADHPNEILQETTKSKVSKDSETELIKEFHQVDAFSKTSNFKDKEGQTSIEDSQMESKKEIRGTDYIETSDLEKVKSPDIPFIDDPNISKDDYLDFYIGQGKRLQRCSRSFVPMASMECLSLSEDPPEADQLPLYDIAKSRGNKKRSFWNILDCMSRRR